MSQPYINRLSLSNRFGRGMWRVVYALLFRPSPTFMHAWRRTLLRCFGAEVGRGCHPYPKCRIWAPWNVSLGKYSCLANDVDCYSVAAIHIGAYTTVSQYAFLCTASHDYNDPRFTLTYQPISVGDRAWICARAYIGPGVSVGDGAVIAACAVAVKDVAEWTVVAGHPARFVTERLNPSR